MDTNITDHPDISACIAACPFYDSHSHMAGMDTGSPLDDHGDMSLAMILGHDYLAYLAGSCSNVSIPLGALSTWENSDHGRQFKAITPLIDACRNMSTYAAFREGIRELHDFKEDDITDANWERLDRSIRETYVRHGERAWQREVLRRCGVKRQVQVCQFPYIAEHWASLPPAERAAQAEVLRPSLVIDGYCYTGLAQNKDFRKWTLEKLNAHPATLKEHEGFCEKVLDSFVAGGGRSVKLLSAYVRTLRFEPVAESTANRLFLDGPEKLSPESLKTLQDYLVVRVLEMALARNLPLIIHTGYSIPLDWGYPEHLLPIFQNPRLKGLKIALAHVGWPRYEAAIVLARTYRNCYFDMSWNPLLSPTSAHRILSEAIDFLPRNKILIGTDTGSAESFCGTARMVRSTLQRALSAKVKERQFSVKEACRFAEHILWRNPNEFFNESP